MRPTLSIVIPAYNEEANLVGCLDAIARQAVAPDEVIIVNNNSTDRTVQVAAGYPFATVISEAQQGIVYAHRAGFNYASGEYIARIDAETLLPPDWVERVKLFYTQPGNAYATLAGAGYFTNLKAPWFTGWLMRNSFQMLALIMGHNPLWGPNFVVPKLVWQQVGAKTCEPAEFDDLDLSLHLHRQGFSIHRDGRLRVGAQLRHAETMATFWHYCWRGPRTLMRHYRVRAGLSAGVGLVLFLPYYAAVRLLQK